MKKLIIMKKLIAIVIAVTCMLQVSNVVIPAGAQEGEEPTLCELLEQTRDKACEEADAASEEAEDPEAKTSGWKLQLLCIRLKIDHREFCVDSEQ